MKMRYLVLLVTLVLYSCSSIDDGIDCELFDPAFPQLYLKIIDSNGSNLVENGYLSSEDIEISGSFQNAGGQVVSSSTSVSPVNNTLALFIAQETNFEYQIQIGEIQQPILAITAEKRDIPCGIFFFVPSSARSGNSELVIEELRNLQYLITVILQ